MDKELFAQALARIPVENINNTQELSEARKSICNECENKVGIMCGKCMCAIPLKTKVLSTFCPAEKW